MAAIIFPPNPTLNQEFTPVGGLVTYKWNGTFWQLATAEIASSASFANSARSASFATTSSFSARSTTSSFSLTGLTASFAISSSFAVRSTSSSFALTASYIQPSTASDAISASYALTASNVETSSFAFTASLLTSTASHAISASFALTASNVQTSSFAFSASLARTASNALTASNVQTSSFSLTSSLARTASFLAGTASRAVTASNALTASNVQTSSFAFTSSTAFTSSWAINALNGGSRVVVSTSVPATSSASGTLWWNTENGNLYIQTQGPEGSQWAPSNATVGTSVISDTASYAFTASYISTASLANTASYFSGSGAEIYDIPAAAILGLNLAAISSGSATASFSINGGNRSFQINTNTAVTGTLTTTRIIADTASFIFSTTVFETSSISFVTGSTKFGTLPTNTHEFTGSVSVTGSLISQGNFTITGSTDTIGNTTTVGSFVLSGSLNLHQSASVSGTNVFGTASWADNTSTASFVRTLSQNVVVTGSLGVFVGTGTELEVASTGVKIGNAQIDNHLVTGSVGITGSLTVIGGIRGVATTASFLDGDTTIYFSANKSTIQSIPATTVTTVVDWATPLINTLPSAWNNATGIFTIPRAGAYEVYGQLMLGSVAAVVGGEIAIIIDRNGTTVSTGQFFAENTSNILKPSITTTTILSCAQGDTLSLRVFQGLASGTAVNTFANRNMFVIKELPRRINRV
jgi:hypothetical protein